jgi:hypothetical protein
VGRWLFEVALVESSYLGISESLMSRLVMAALLS